MKTFAAVALAATFIASPVFAQENDRTLLPSEIGPQVTASVRHPVQHPSVANAYASAVQAPASGATDPDPFIRSQLSRDALSN
jgi:hypothetical protein